MGRRGGVGVRWIDGSSPTRKRPPRSSWTTKRPRRAWGSARCSGPEEVASFSAIRSLRFGEVQSYPAASRDACADADGRMSRTLRSSTASRPASARLARLADLAYRRRGRVVLARIALLAGVVAVAPCLAGDFSSEFATAGSESQAAADLIAERFPGISGDTIEVVWQAQAGAREPRV